jgi:hypothetical protein
MRSWFVALCALFGLAAGAHADPIDRSICHEEPASAADFGLARVGGAPRLYLRWCPPGASDCQEMQKTPYVIPGDTVIVGAHAGAAACAVMPNRHQWSAGWADADKLTPLPLAPVSLTDWTGRWTMPGGDEVDLKLKDGKLAISGAACWPSCDGSSRLKYGPNVGELEDAVAPVGNHLISNEGDGDDGCKAEMWRIGAYLLVFDNRQCGGMNVSFTGVYQRRAAQRLAP